MITSDQIITKLLNSESVPESAQNQLLAKLKAKPGASKSSIRDYVSESLKNYASDHLKEAIISIAVVFDKYASSQNVQLREQILKTYQDFKTEPALAATVPIITLLQEDSSLTALIATSPALAQTLIADPPAGIQNTANLIDKDAKGISVVSKLINPLAAVSPQIAEIQTAGISVFKNFIPTQNPETASNLLVTYKLLNPDSTPKEINTYITDNIPITSTVPPTAINSYSQLLSKFKFSDKEVSDVRFHQSLTFYLVQEGIDPEIANKIAPALASTFKPAYYLVSLADIPDTLSAEAKQEEEAKAFSALSQSAREQFIESQTAQKNIPQGQQLQIDPNKLYSFFNKRYQSPQNIDPKKEFGTSANNFDTHFHEYLNYISSQPERWLRDHTVTSLNNFLTKTELGQKIASSEEGRFLLPRIQKAIANQPQVVIRSPFESLKGFSQVDNAGKIAKVDNFLDYANHNAFQKSLPVRQAVGKVAAKIGETTVGKAVAAKVAASATAQAILQTVGSAVPIVGNIIAFVAGLIMSEFISKIYIWLKEKYEESKEFFQAGIVATSSLFVIPFGFFTSQTVRALFQPILFAVVILPVFLAFVLLIINSSAYVVPYTRDNITINITPPAGNPPPGELGEPLPNPYPSFVPGGGGGFPPGGGSCASGCPIIGGIITNGSYNPDTEHGHGSNRYWSFMNPSNPCHWDYGAQPLASLPQSAGCYAPDQPSQNYCYLDHTIPKCSYYGYAIDVFAPIRGYEAPVFLPLVDGRFATWTSCGGFTNPSAGVTAYYCAPGARIILTHLNSNYLRGSFASGTQIGTLFNQGGNTHLHIEFQLNSVYRRPEEFFCGGGGGGGGGQGCVPLNSCLTPNYCAPHGACLADGGTPGARLDCTSTDICCEVPTAITRCISPNYCTPRGACLGDGGTPGPRLDCSSTNICCSVD
jgi:hypothetical protein